MPPKKNAKGGKQKGGAGGGKQKGAGDSAGGKGGKGGKLKTVKEVKARHILNEKHSKIMECYQKMTEQWTDLGRKVPPAEFAKLAVEYSECSSKNKGGDLGWFGRGKMVRAFEDVAFSTEKGDISYPFKTAHGYHIVLVEGRRN